MTDKGLNAAADALALRRDYPPQDQDCTCIYCAGKDTAS